MVWLHHHGLTYECLCLFFAAPSEYFYLLCDALPEDKEIRQKLQEEKLVRNLVDLFTGISGLETCTFIYKHVHLHLFKELPLLGV